MSKKDTQIHRLLMMSKREFNEIEWWNCLKNEDETVKERGLDGRVLLTMSIANY
jgi:hypothetical protein